MASVLHHDYKALWRLAGKMSAEMDQRRGLCLAASSWSARKGRVPSLDGVRAASILLVLMGHILLPTAWVGVSAIGLKTFFFISGFLITRLLLAESKANDGISLGAFYGRRLLRLYPVLVVYVIVVAAVTAIRGEAVHPIEIAAVFLYFVNYLVIHYDQLRQAIALPIGMFWSLSVEEHFYLLAPLTLVLVRGNARKMLIAALCICVAAISLRLFYAWLRPEVIDTLELYWRSETRFDCIAFGVILACLPETPRGRSILQRLCSPTIFVLAFVLLVASFLVRDDYFQLTWRFTIQSLALIPLVAGVIFAAPFPWINTLLNTNVMGWIGALSYSLYVWHGGVMYLFGDVLELLPSKMLHLAELTVAFVLAAASYYLIERPTLRLGSALRKGKPSGAAAGV